MRPVITVACAAALALLPACTDSEPDSERSGGAVSSTTTTRGTRAETSPPTGSSLPPPGADCGERLPPAETPSVRGLTDLEMVSPLKGFAVGNDVILVTDDGRNWVERHSQPSAFIAVEAVDENHAWALTQHDIWATDDGGRHWRPRREPVEATLQHVRFIDAENGWGVASGHVFRTTDGGRSWTLADPSCGAQAVCFTGPDDGWAAKGFSVFRSTDGGRSWATAFTLPVAPDRQFHPETTHIDQLECTRPGVVWVVFAGSAAGTTRTPFVTYRGTAGGDWFPVMKAGGDGPPAIAAPTGGSYPAPISAVSADSAVTATYTPLAPPRLGIVTATAAGRTLTARRPVPALFRATSMSFLSLDTGWLLGPETGTSETDAILATRDGGRTWEEQLIRPVPPGD